MYVLHQMEVLMNTWTIEAVQDVMLKATGFLSLFYSLSLSLCLSVDASFSHTHH